VTLETDANAQVTARVDMEAFGTVLTGGQTGFRLTTKGYDCHVGLYYFSTRWLDSNTGLFLERPAMPPFREHPYSSNENNPIRNTDPTGQYVQLVVTVAIVGVLYVTAYYYLESLRDDAHQAVCRSIANIALTNLVGQQVSPECLHALHRAAGQAPTGCKDYCGYLQRAQQVCAKEGVRIDSKYWER